MGIDEMILPFVIYIVSVICFNTIDCRQRSKIHVNRRQVQEMHQKPNKQIFQASYLPQPFYLESPIDSEMNSLPVTVSQPGDGGSENLGLESVGLAPANTALEEAGLAPGKATLNHAGLTPGNINSAFYGLLPGNVEQGQDKLATEKFVQGYSRLASNNAFPSNVRLASENTLPNNAGLVPESALLSNVESEPGNAVAGDSDVAAGNAAPNFYEMNRPGSAHVPSGNVVIPPENAALHSGNFKFSGIIGISPVPESILNVESKNQNQPNPPLFQQNGSLTTLLKALPNLNSSELILKRQKKNAPYKYDELDELLQTGKKLFEDSYGSNERYDRRYLKLIYDNAEKDLNVNNATLIPIPKGVQIKTVTKQGNKIVNSVANITSSTQRTKILDNITEIENVLEMQMEKNIEDDTGDNRGSEEVHIIETERVKPLVDKKFNSLTLQTGKPNKRFLTHRKKRSLKFHIDFHRRSNSVFNKTGHRDLEITKKNGRLLKSYNFPNRQMALNLKEDGRRRTVDSDEPPRDELIPDKNEVDDFLQHFLKQIRMYIKSQEKNNTMHHPTRKMKTEKKKFDLIMQVNVTMNLDLTRNTMMKDPVKSRNATENQNQLTMNVTTKTPMNSSTDQIPYTLIYHDDRNNSILAMTFLFLIILLSMLIIMFIKQNLRRLSDLNRKSRTYRFHQGGKSDEFKGIKYAPIEDACKEDDPELEWQSENGDWLIEKSSDYKG